MIKLNIDISDVSNDFNLILQEAKDLSNNILDRLVAEYNQRWDMWIDMKLNRTKAEYRRGIEIERPDDYTAIIALTSRKSKLALMLEDGASAFDIKAGLRKSQKRKTSIGGNWYIDVPFRFATSKAAAFSPAFTGGVAPAGVIRAAKKAAGAAVPIAALPKKNRDAKIRHGINRKIDNVFHSVPQYKHKVSIFAGIRRIETGTAKKKSGVYQTFRRVSDNSDPFSWIHQGFQPRHLMLRALASLTPHVDTIVDAEINKFLASR